MSIFDKLKNAEHTLAGWAQKELAKVLGEAPTFLQIADTTLSYAGPILQTILGAAGQTAAASEAGKIIAEAQQDVIVIRAVITDAGPVPSAAAMLQSVQENLTGLLAFNHITNPVSVALVNRLLKEFAALLENFPAPVPPTA